MMRKVKVKSPKKSSTLKRMKVPKLELPTAQFGASIIGGTSQPDPGNIRTDTKEDAIERANRGKASLGERFKYGIAGFVAPALEWVGAEGVGQKWEENAKKAGAGKAFHVGNSVGEVGSAVGKFFTGDYQGMAGDLAEAGGSAITARGYGQWEKGNDKKSEKLIKAGESIEGIGNMVTKTSFSGGMSGGMSKAGGMGKAGGMSGGMKGMKGGMKGFDTLDSFDTFDMNTTSGVNSLPFGKFGIKLPLEMELMPENGKMVDGYLHKEGGVITTDRKKPVAEIEGGEGIIEDVVFSNTTINSETGKPFSKDAERLINSKDTSKEGKNTQRLEKERLYIKQEEEKIKQGLVNRGEEMAMKKYKKGGSLKSIPSDNKGLPKLPESVRNQMGYMKSGGGLYANIHAKRRRIANGSGETMRKPGTEGAPTNKDFVRSERTAKETAMYGKKLNLPKMQGGDKIPKKQLKTLRDQVSSGSLTFANGADFSEMNMAGPRTAYVDGKEQIVESPINSFTDLGLRSLKVFPKKLDNFKLDKFNNFKRDKFNFEIGTPSIQGDIYSSTEETATGKPKIKSLSERFLNPAYSSKYNKTKSLYEEKKKKEDGEDGKGNLTPGDITQLAGNMVAPLANLAAMKSIRENTVDLGRDRSIIRERKISNADKERTARQTLATLVNADISDDEKAAAAARTTEDIQNIRLATDTANAQMGFTKDQLDMQKSQFNIGQGDKEAIDKQIRKDLATTTGLTAAEQIGTGFGNLGLTMNQGATNLTQLGVLKKAFPNYTITQDNVRSFIRALSSGKEEDIIKFRKPEGE